MKKMLLEKSKKSDKKQFNDSKPEAQKAGTRKKKKEEKFKR